MDGRITYGSVCSGIDAASVAWAPLGFKPLWLSEIDAFPNAVLSHRWPGVPNLGDMTGVPDMLRAGVIPQPDVVIGGTPCQAFSSLGHRKSLDDDRGLLTLKYEELINDSVFIWENVPGVLNTKDNAFGHFLGCMAGHGQALESPVGSKWPNAGYLVGPKRRVAWRILDAKYFGVPQRRRRVFVVGHSGCIDPGKILFEPRQVRRSDNPPGEARQKSTAGRRDSATTTYCGTINDALRDVGADVAPTMRNGGAGAVPGVAVIHGAYTDVSTGCCHSLTSGSSTKEDTLVHSPDRPRQITPRERERLQGFPDDYTLVPWRGGLASDTLRARALGNSMAVPVIRWLGERIKNYGTY